ncbi:hypothetical protein PHLGIDRAFT_72529 [Phlebiopsis gigantea 11061_1 CR5-6]|uniref:Prefoldin subunit 3 n=1 Tax=Phlebiopsis gigantea (strain 11061_1 CR5-6) TaxID=745531 RepID=A0A0C3NNA5_PHLG1|nr:hypothetical protein PHLGIDRAFT_72529 [Phlebiopsis gigantea 11061_1 CR5-6]
MSAQDLATQERNARGIPKAPFIADVAEYLGPNPEVESALKEFQAALAKYRYMDQNLAQRRRGLEEKIPDIKKTLSMIEYLKERRVRHKPLTTTFELNDTLYAEAELEDTDTVYLWLGANVMLSYKIPEAIALLRSKLDSAESNLKNVIEDLEFLREQITVMEVNTARVYNWDVKRRRDLREQEAKELTSKETS